MIVCHCKGVTDKEIRKYSSLKEVKLRCRAGTGCGTCIPYICEIVREENDKMTYEYKCKNCGYCWEHESKINEDPLKECPKCKEETATRLISGGTGFQLKGSGWFKTGGY